LSNALDHGIETPEVRAEQQKALPARIIITGTRTGRSIYFSVTDDGRGINTDKVLAKAIEKGLIAPGSKMTQEAIWQFCIASELSTAKTVTETSGRGIGLNAVDEKIRRLGGKGLTISWSEQGKGARFEFSIDIKGAVQ
jgi:two-component system chemotaxis sensor kinase CheA